ncbi:MAG: sulfite exporter TauE/SafE family protein [Betaproteobacteria bacterium]|nr:sulfite exporter TauE/SafE family protein [Betaproteobacteria bacterium]
MFDAFSLLQLTWAAFVVFGAYVVRGMSGFGAGLVATPLLAFVFPMTQVVPTTALLVFVLFIFLTLRDRASVLWDEFWRLLPPTLLGVAFGLYLFSVLDNRMLTKLLGGFLMAYACYMLVADWIGMQQLKLSTRWAWPLGFGGALIDAMFGGGGGTLPVIYMHARQVTRAAFRATLAVLWFVEMIARIGGYAVAGFYTANTLTLVALLLPFVALGTWAGEKIGNRLTPAAFNRILAVLLLLSGVSLLLK